MGNREITISFKLYMTMILIDGDVCEFSALSPEIHHHLLGLVDVE